MNFDGFCGEGSINLLTGGPRKNTVRLNKVKQLAL